MSICRQMDKEVVVHIQNGILLNELDETGTYYTVK